MDIKTIVKRLSYAEDFDRSVNEAIAEGWTLDKRYISQASSQDGYYVHRMLIAEMIRPDIVDKSAEIRVKYFDPEIEKLQKISNGDWIDLRSAETVHLKKGEYYLIRLGVGMILPDGYEAHILPRSSTPSKFGIMCANSQGVIDNSYSGDADEWQFPAVAIRDTIIKKNDRICQFRIVKNQPGITFEVVDHLNEISRGGIGSTGKR